jgi:methyl-accepting chemotaxis protein
MNLFAWRKSVRARVTLLMGGLLFAAIALITTLNTLSMKSLIDERVNQVELPAVVAELNASIEQQLTEPITVSKNMAENTLLHRWSQSGEPAEREGEIIEYLRQSKDKNAASVAFWVSEGTGKYYNQDGVLKTVSRNEARDNWFYDFLASGQSYSLSFDTDEANQVPTVFVNYAVRIAGQTVAAAGIGRSLESLRDTINQYGIGEKGLVYLVDAKGNVKVHRDAAVEGTLNSVTGRNDMTSVLLADAGFHVDEFTRQGTDYIIASQQIPSIGWYLVAEVPRDELYGGLYAAVTTSTVVASLVAAVFIVLVYIMSGGIVNPLKTIADALTEIADQGGDLTRQVPVQGEDEVGQLADAFNRFVSSQRELVLQVLKTAQEGHRITELVSTATSKTSEMSLQQQTKTDLVATAIHQMGATVEEIARNANQTAQYSRDAKDEVALGEQASGEAIARIEQLSNEVASGEQVVSSLAEEVVGISSVLDVIRGISEQTNLLALNAAIEAARAGEQGRGFAVVADEVRTLAQRTQESTEEINNMIERLQRGAKEAVTSMKEGRAVSVEGVETVQQLGQYLREIVGKIEHISDMNIQIASATEEQSSVTEDINENVAAIANQGRETAQLATDSADNCKVLINESNNLQRLVGQFKV